MKGKKRGTFIIILFLVMIMAWQAPVRTAFAESAPAVLPSTNMQGENQSQPKCWPLDVVLLVDQSYSMFERWPLNAPIEQRNPPSDPDGYRFDAADEILDRLIQNRQDECPKAVHRFGLITFGDHPVRVLDMVHIDLSPTDKSETWAQKYRGDIARAAQDRSQEGTDPQAAFDEAQLMLGKAEDIPTPAEYGPRRSVVILVTDGSPDGVGTVPSYMCRMVKDLTEQTLLDSSIWMLALNASTPYLDNQGCNGRIRDDYKAMLGGANRARKGELNSLAYNHQAIPSFVSDVVSAEFGHPGTPLQCGEVFYVDPYLEQAIFTFFHDKSIQTTPVILSYLGEQPGQPVYQLNAGKVTLNAGNDNRMTLQSYKTREGKEEIIINRPRPGSWRFDLQDISTEQCQGRVIASEVPIKPVVTLISPRAGIPVPVVEESPFMDKAGLAPIVIELRGKDGQPIPFESTFPLVIKAKWNLPAGQSSLPDGSSPAEIDLSPAPDSRWSSGGSVIAPYEGNYVFNVVGDTLFGNGQEGNHFFSESFSYNARKIEAFGFRILSPQTNERVACNQVVNGASQPQPVHVRIELNNEQQAAVDHATYIVSDVKEAFAASIYDEKGAVIGSPISMRPVPEEKGVFEADLPLGTETDPMCGDVNVQVDFTGKYATDKYTLPKDHQTVSLTRVKASGVQANLLGLKDKDIFRLHETFANACPGGFITPIKFDLELHDLDGALLDPQDVAQSDPTQLYTGKLTAPDGSLKSVTFTRMEREQGFVLSAEVGADVSQTGEYHIEVVPNQAAFKPEYVASQAKPIKVAVNREDAWNTKPLTCQLSMGFSGLLAAGIMGLLVFGFTGGPGGSLEIIRSNETSPIITLPLRKSRWFAKAKGKDLEELGIGEIDYAKSKGWSGEDKRAVHLTVKSTEGEDVFDSVVESEDRQGFVGDFDVRYS